MAANWILTCILVTIISQAQSQRKINHIIFKYLNFTTKSTTTTNSLNVDSRDGVTLPPKNAHFLDSLMNRKSYFQSNGWSGKSNSDRNVEISKPPATTTEAYSTSVGENDSRRILNQDARTTTTAPTTSRRDLTTTLSRTKPDVDKDPQSQPSLTDQWLNNIMRPPRIQQNWGRATSTERPINNPQIIVQQRDQPSNVEDTSTTTTPAQTQRSSSWTNEDADNSYNGGAYIVDDSSTESPTNGVTRGNWEEPTNVDVQDKPFYGTNPGWLFGNNETSESEQEDSTGQQSGRDKVNNRGRRAASPGASNGTSCDDTAHFEQCQYYPKCFPEIDSKCKSRYSFIGDEVSRFCTKTSDKTLTNQSELLKSYMKKVELCVRDELSKFLESPSCDDVTLCLTRALLVKSRSSCLFQEGIFCSIMDDIKARPELARIVTSPTADVDFMSRLMVNIADLTSFCRSQGSSIFVTDITMLATDKDGPFKEKYSNTPIPSVVLKV